MSAEIVTLQADTFRPRRPARNKEVEIVVAGDTDMLAQIEVWARSRREVIGARAEPLLPTTRANALEILAIIKHQPR